MGTVFSLCPVVITQQSNYKPAACGQTECPMENTFPFQTNEKLASVLNLGLKFGSDIDLVFRRRLFPIVESL